MRARLRHIRNYLLGLAAAAKPTRPQARSVRLGVECLEARLVLSGGVAPGFLLDNSGNLYHSTGSGQQLIDTGVLNFSVANDKVFDLHTDNTLQSLNSDGSGKATLDTNVVKFVAGPEGNAYTLDAADNLGVNGVTVSGPIGPVSQFALTPDGGTVVALSAYDHTLYSASTAGWQWVYVAGNTSALAQASDGTTLIVQNGVLWGHVAGAPWGQWGYIAASIQALAQADDGTTLIVQNGVLQNHAAGAPWGQWGYVAGSVSALAQASDGTTLIVQNGVLQNHTAGAPWGQWGYVAGNISALAQAPDGTTLILQNGALQGHTAGAAWGQWCQVRLGSLSAAQWTVNQPGYSNTIAVAGGSACASLAVTGLPPGLTAALLGNTITISGTPTKSGPFTQVAVSWSVPGIPWATLTATYSLTVNPPPSLGALDATQRTWTVNQAGYTGIVPIMGGTAGYSLVAATGLPPGLTVTLSGIAITLSGTPTLVGTFNNVALTLRDSTGATASGTYNLTVNPPPSLGALAGTQWTANQPGYAGTIPVNGGTPGYSIAAVTGLPPGFTAYVSGNAVSLSGTPTQAGIFNIAVTLQDGAGAGCSGIYTLTVAPASYLTLGPASLSSETAGQGYGVSLATSGGYGSYSYQLIGGGLPAGLTLSGAGALTGTATAAGTYNFIVQARDIALPGLTGTQAYTLTVTPAAVYAIAVSPSTSNPVTGQPFTVTITATDRYGNRWSGAVALASSNGQVVATPASVSVSNGTGTVTLQAAHGGNVTLTASAGGVSGSAGLHAVYTGYVGYTMTFNYSYHWTDAYGYYHSDQPWVSTAANLAGAAFNPSDPRNALNVSQAQLQAVAVARGLVYAKDGGLGSFSSLSINLYYIDADGYTVFVNSFSGL